MPRDVEPDLLRVDVLLPSDVGRVMDMAASEGWNPGLNDGPIFHSVDPQGWFGCYEGGELLGAAVASNYDADFSFFGLYIVRSDRRGEGIGSLLTQAVMRHSGDRCLGMDGVLGMKERYRDRMSMKPHYESIRWMAETASHSDGWRVDLREDSSIKELQEYDRLHFPASRERFLELWTGQEGGRTLSAVDAKGGLIGFGTVRPCIHGHKVGPLFADDDLVAEALLRKLTARLPGPWYLDVPEVNRPAMRLAEGLGMTPVFRTARMYSRSPPGFRIDGVFGVTSFELG